MSYLLGWGDESLDRGWTSDQAWNPTTTSGIQNWQDWANTATDKSWSDYTDVMGVDRDILQNTISNLTPYDSYTLGWGNEGLDRGWTSDQAWNPTTTSGISNWQNWANTATDKEWADYANTMGSSRDTLQNTISSLTPSDSSLLGYDQFGDTWYENSGGTNWDPSTDDGKANWLNWANDATETGWQNYADQLGISVAAAKDRIKKVFPDADTFVDDPNNSAYGNTLKRLQDLVDQGTFNQQGFLDDYNQSIDDYSANVDTMTDQMKALNNLDYRNAVQPALQRDLNSLAGRNMINSSVAGDTMSKTLTNLAAERSRQNMAADAQAAEFKLRIPELKADALNTWALTSSQTLAPYQLLLDAMYNDMYGGTALGFI